MTSAMVFKIKEKFREIAESASELSAIQYALIILLALLIMAGAITSYIKSRPTKIEIIDSQKKERCGEEKIKVHVAGAVIQPGLYEMEKGTRVADAVKAAGGSAPDALIDKINLAETLRDGQKITVPRKGESPPDGSGLTGINPVISERNKKININTASAEELETLPGIGPALASKIVKYRNEKGQFSSIQSLKKVPGIGQKKFESIKDLVEI